MESRVEIYSTFCQRFFYILSRHFVPLPHIHLPLIVVQCVLFSLRTLCVCDFRCQQMPFPPPLLFFTVFFSLLLLLFVSFLAHNSPHKPQSFDGRRSSSRGITCQQTHTCENMFLSAVTTDPFNRLHVTFPDFFFIPPSFFTTEFFISCLEISCKKWVRCFGETKDQKEEEERMFQGLHVPPLSSAFASLHALWVLPVKIQQSLHDSLFSPWIMNQRVRWWYLRESFESWLLMFLMRNPWCATLSLLMRMSVSASQFKRREWTDDKRNKREEGSCGTIHYQATIMTGLQFASPSVFPASHSI